MNRTKKVLFSFPVLAIILIMGSLAPAYSASNSHSNQNAKSLYAINDSDSFHDLVVVSIIKNNAGEFQVTAGVFIEGICQDFGVPLSPNEYGWSISKGWASFNSPTCGQVDVVWTSAGEIRKVHRQTAGDESCNETFLSSTFNGRIRDASVIGLVGGIFPIIHTPGSLTDEGDGVIIHGVNSVHLCEPTPGKRS